MLKCTTCGNKARGTISAICRKCGGIMLPHVEKRYEYKKPKEEIEDGDR